jgi:peptidoglycan hydrolase-like protein with peptidoglycan-binding domain
MVRQVQTTLHQQGTYAGNIDGIWGPETQGAVRSYQQSHGLMVNGQLDSPTLASLNLPGDSTAPATAPAAPAATTSSAAPATTMPAPAAQPVTTSSTTTTAPAAQPVTTSSTTTTAPATPVTQ